MYKKKNNKENEICFITCVNDERMYDECCYYIDKLNKPRNMCVEKIAIKDAKNITEAYNRAMNMSDAKYKVYLHQDAFIINKNFIYDIIKQFNNKNLGLIGVIGAEYLNKDCIWWNSEVKFGKVYENSCGIMRELAFENKDKKVQALDGLILITQYDLMWNEKFNGWHYYDIVQSQEFLLNGFDVMVPQQEEPWILHDCGIIELDEKYEFYRKKFIEIYK